MTRDLNYAQVGATRPGEQTWSEEPSGYRRYERTVSIGQGSAHWKIVTSDVLAWEVKSRSGFTVKSMAGESIRVQPGTDYVLTAALGPFSLREPVRVVATVDQVDRCGFAYGTLEGHPVSGEEAFIVYQDADAVIDPTISDPPCPWPLAPGLSRDSGSSTLVSLALPSGPAKSTIRPCPQTGRGTSERPDMLDMQVIREFVDRWFSLESLCISSIMRPGGRRLKHRLIRQPSRSSGLVLDVASDV